jgi:hypothetical protein
MDEELIRVDRRGEGIVVLSRAGGNGLVSAAPMQTRRLDIPTNRERFLALISMLRSSPFAHNIPAAETSLQNNRMTSDTALDYFNRG